jgi:predicted aspartyl protease
MISGEFNQKGELIFEIGLIAADGDVIPVKSLLDTGFTGWLAINTQDADSLEWILKLPFMIWIVKGSSD